MSNITGVRLFKEILVYGYYDGVISGTARSWIPEINCVWFQVIAVHYNHFARIYALSHVEPDDYAEIFKSATIRYPDDPVRGDISEAAMTQIASANTKPAWLCVSEDGLDSIAIIRKLSSELSSQLPANLMPEPHFPMDNELFEHWLRISVNFRSY